MWTIRRYSAQKSSTEIRSKTIYKPTQVIDPKYRKWCPICDERSHGKWMQRKFGDLTQNMKNEKFKKSKE